MTRLRWRFLAAGLLLGMFIGAGVAVAFQDGAGVSWVTYVDRRLEDFRGQMDERFSAQQEAIRVFSESNVRTLATVNEFRGALSDAQRLFVSKDAFAGLVARVDALEQSKAALEGGAAKGATITTATFAVTGLILTALGIAIAWVLHRRKTTSKGA